MTTRQFFEITYRDKFDSKKNYNKLDIIKFMGEFYVCTKDGTVGINPSNSEYFHKLEFFDEQESKITQEKQAESEKYEKTFDAGYENGYAQARFDYEQEPCEDSISRQAVLALAKEECDTAIIPYRRFVKDINALPPVTPQPKTGHWIFKKFDEESGISDSYWCSVCNHPMSQVYNNYCGCCGCTMFEPQESEDKE